MAISCDSWPTPTPTPEFASPSASTSTLTTRKAAAIPPRAALVPAPPGPPQPPPPPPPQQQQHMSRSPQLRDRLAATAHPQAASPFFERLPAEIRHRIYKELWRLHDTRWHIHTVDGGHVAPVFPCLCGPDDEDTRYANFRASREEHVVVWENRLRSPWNTHWRCAEAAAARSSRLRRRRVSPTDPIRFLPQLSAPLLVCKRMYYESIGVLEDVSTLCFTDVVAARDFLARYSTAWNVRNIDISLRLKPLLTELYFPGPDGEPQPHVAGLPVTCDNNPWEDLCARLCDLPRLCRLHLRLDSEDLRPWHKRVHERRFLARLFGVRARVCVLYLPEIPQAPELQGLPGCYLEGDALEGAPFELQRGPRPNNWQLHLSRISHTLPNNWGHTLWNQVQGKIWAT